ncbi:hypothetical protein AVEN_42750-1 [Araneus ventricosus]|uniref:Uncharacterized protein n=1 Tax=Araneus ventricosus TaxID=182803 RepID=A0A4Y2AEA3_ARAVE|nr:hypothetical protein AVEN_42750-1 [Araneus ventricosus]
MYYIIPCDVMASRARLYKRRQPKGGMTLELLLKCELRAVESAVSVIISDLLTAVFLNLKVLLLLLLVNRYLFALLICTRAIVPVISATGFPEYLGI